jgi:hypothetical protein
MINMSELNTNKDLAYSTLTDNDVVDLVLSSAASFDTFRKADLELNLVYSGYNNSMRLAFATEEELLSLGYEALANNTLFNRVTSAFSSILPFLDTLNQKAVSLFNKRKSVSDDRKALEDCLHRARTSDKDFDTERLKQLDLYFYEYKPLVNVISTLNHAINENDKYLKNVISSKLLENAFELGYSTASDSGNSEGYARVTVDSKNIKCHPVQLRFFETNTVDDLLFVTDQLTRSCSSLEFMLMHDSQFKSAISALKAKPNRVKSLVGNKDAIMKLGRDVNDMTNHCGRIINNVALLLKVNKTLTTVTRDVWENVLGTLDN